MCSLLPIKHTFFKTRKCSRGLTGSTVGDIENAEKIGANTATGSFAEISKSSYLNFKNKFAIVP